MCVSIPYQESQNLKGGENFNREEMNEEKMQSIPPPTLRDPERIL